MPRTPAGKRIGHITQLVTDGVLRDAHCHLFFLALLVAKGMLRIHFQPQAFRLPHTCRPYFSAN